ncbi:winged helix-turn-helix domain-containing protein [Devosia sp. SL43]|uniref:winged helix-turn-helix domain-containing protein n=1 Tax=Devosia sp. SL43 TaxID=2806348 RepID=UPI001F388322|nr:crosslink repair DNA glycosylase YcaQ family protein [Devosia sp. SL43]UJW84558.1 YcaQ family DNA glycosylase [Devosia sp. SL43]
MPKAPIVLESIRARHLWIRAQRLDTAAPFGDAPEATQAAIAHLGYVQIDTINVIERCHHHILWSRIPGYRRAHLVQAQAADKSVFEYWTHALSYVPSADLPFFLPAMKLYRETPSRWFGSVTPDEVRKMTRRLKTEGPLSIRDIGDDELVDKTHLWGSRKPSKRVLEMMFFQGLVTVSARQGMLKTYDLMGRHFATLPKPATERQVIAYKLDRALRSQGVVSLDSICHLDAPSKKAVKELIDSRVRRRLLMPVTIEGAEKVPHWAAPETLEATAGEPPDLVHILSPFDPLIIQRKRLKFFFGYEHIFEAYVPAAKRQLGYFALPVLMGDRIVAALDLKTDRAAGKLLVQKRTDFAEVGAEGQMAIDEALGRFERFQLGD